MGCWRRKRSPSAERPRSDRQSAISGGVIVILRLRARRSVRPGLTIRLHSLPVAAASSALRAAPPTPSGPPPPAFGAGRMSSVRQARRSGGCSRDGESRKSIPLFSTGCMMSASCPICTHPKRCDRPACPYAPAACPAAWRVRQVSEMAECPDVRCFRENGHAAHRAPPPCLLPSSRLSRAPFLTQACSPVSPSLTAGGVCGGPNNR